MPSSSPNSTYCNKPWKVFFEGTGINSEEVWIGVVSERISRILTSRFVNKKITQWHIYFAFRTKRLIKLIFFSQNSGEVFGMPSCFQLFTLLTFWRKMPVKMISFGWRVLECQIFPISKNWTGLRTFLLQNYVVFELCCIVFLGKTLNSHNV